MSPLTQGLQLLLLLLVAFPVLGAPGIRKEWRKLTNFEKADYIAAVKCLQRNPSKVVDPRYPGAVTRMDDLVLSHILATLDIHNTAQFFPWHRYFVYLHEKLLREECGYRGYQPYWDESLDLPPKGRFVDSPVFAADLGFGGNGKYTPTRADFVFYGVDSTVIPLNGQGTASKARGNDGLLGLLPILETARTGGGCVPNGPFKDLKIRLGPFNATGKNTRCLKRDFAPSVLDLLDPPTALQKIQATDSYENLTALTPPVHGIGHIGAGGLIGESVREFPALQMFNLFSSPNDPLFYLHHANVDRVWWNWQLTNPRKRFSQVTGYAYAFGEKRVTLDFKLNFFPLTPPRPIRDVLDIRRLGYGFVYDDRRP